MFTASIVFKATYIKYYYRAVKIGIEILYVPKLDGQGASGGVWLSLV